MKRFIITILVALPVLSFAQQWKYDETNFKVQPQVVEIENNNMKVNIEVTVAPKSFGKKTLAELTPLFLWNGKEIKGESLRLQGEKLDDNCRIVGYKLGVTDNMSFSVPYEMGMENGRFGIEVDLSRPSGRRKSTNRILFPTKIDGTRMLVYETVKDAQLVSFTTDKSDGNMGDVLFYRSQTLKSAVEKIGALDQALSYNPQDYRILNNLALCYMERGDEDRARECLMKAYKLNPDSPEINGNLCIMALQAGDMDAASDYLFKAEKSPNYNEAFGTMLLMQGQQIYATTKLNGVATNTGVLAHILNQEYAEASRLIDQNPKKNGMTYYLQALLGVKMEDEEVVKQGIEKLRSVAPLLHVKAAKSDEFSKYKDLFKFPER